MCGIAKSEELTENGMILKEWCAAGMNASMAFLHDDIGKRINPSILFPGTRSVIVTGLNYYSELSQEKNVPVIARYAYGADYHKVIKEKLNRIIERISEIAPKSSSKAYVDTAPILEKAWAGRAGLGWQGKNSVVINRHIGSFFFLGIILTDLELEYDKPHAEDLCGTCRLCIDSCPVDAINENRTINAGKCLAFLTIESKEPVSHEFEDKLKGRIFGCDICQDACPWNKNAKKHNTPEFEISAELSGMTIDQWKNLSEEKFKQLFGNSTIGRKKYELFMQNVTIVTKSGKNP